MNLIDEIHKLYESDCSQMRGPSPGKEGGSDTRRFIQPLAPKLSKKGVIRSVVPGNFPRVTTDKSGKITGDTENIKVINFLKGIKHKKQNFNFEQRLAEAIFSNQQFLEEAVKRQKPVRKEMSGTKKALIGAALAAALAGGIASSSKKSGPETQNPTVTNTYTGAERGPSGQGKDPRSMGNGRVTTDKDLNEAIEMLLFEATLVATVNSVDAWGNRRYKEYTGKKARALLRAAKKRRQGKLPRAQAERGDDGLGNKLPVTDIYNKGGKRRGRMTSVGAQWRDDNDNLKEAKKGDPEREENLYNKIANKIRDNQIKNRRGNKQGNREEYFRRLERQEDSDFRKTHEKPSTSS